VRALWGGDMILICCVVQAMIIVLMMGWISVN
jgi:hypothetical protein